MTWDWKKALESKDNPDGVPAAKDPDRLPKPPRARGAQQAYASPEIRHDAGIVLRSTGAHVAGRAADPPELLYGKEYECAFCGGEGQFPNESQCPVCRGSGQVVADPPVVRCAFCHGRGQVPPRSALTCCVCRGSGVAPVKAPIRICPECKGRGKKPGQSLYCAGCRGAGVVTSPEQCTDGGGVSTAMETRPNIGRKAS